MGIYIKKINKKDPFWIKKNFKHKKKKIYFF